MSYIKQKDDSGETYTLKAAQDGVNVDLQLDAAAGTDSEVKLKPGTNITLTEAADTITIDSAGAGGSIGVNQVAYGDPLNAGDIKGSDDLTWDQTNKQLTVTGDADNDAVVEIVGSETAASEGPRLVVKNDVGTPSAIDFGVDNFAVGIIRGGTPGGTMREVMRFGQMSTNEFVTRFNNGGLPADFAVQTDNETNMLFVDGGQDNVGIGTAPDSGIERLHVKGTGLTDMVVFEGTSEGSGATDGPDLILYNSATPTGANKFIGRLEWRGKNDAAAAKGYGSIQTFIQDETAGTEDSLMLFKTFTAGSALEKLRFNLGGTEINATGSASLDFDVKTSSSTQQSFFKTYNSATIADRYTEVLRGTLTVSTTPRTITEDYCYGSNVYMTGSASVITLPEGLPGMHLQVVNGGLTGLTMNPAAGEEINGSASAYSLTNGYKITKVICVAAGVWVASD